LPERVNRWLVLVLFIVAAFATSAIGGLATASSVGTWYPTLNKPSWNPPAWIFGPVWSLLYVAMSVAAWRVWLIRTTAPGAGWTLRLWFAQLLLNALWSVLFFGLRSPGAAVIEIVPLWALLVALQFRLARADRVAAFLWAPYLSWVSFAAFLNFTIWRLN
jgi:tryptophan-rich sensory protein